MSNATWIAHIKLGVLIAGFIAGWLGAGWLHFSRGGRKKALA